MKVSSHAPTDTLGARVYDRLRRRCDPLFQRLLTTIFFRMLGFEIVSRVARTSKRLRRSLDRRFRATSVTHVRSAEIGRLFPRENHWFDVETNRAILFRNVTGGAKMHRGMSKKIDVTFAREEREKEQEWEKQANWSEQYLTASSSYSLRVSISFEHCRVSLIDTRSIYCCSMYRYRILFLN